MPAVPIYRYSKVCGWFEVDEEVHETIISFDWTAIKDPPTYPRTRLTRLSRKPYVPARRLAYLLYQWPEQAHQAIAVGDYALFELLTKIQRVRIVNFNPLDLTSENLVSDAMPTDVKIEMPKPSVTDDLLGSTPVSDHQPSPMSKSYTERLYSLRPDDTKDDPELDEFDGQAKDPPKGLL